MKEFVMTTLAKFDLTQDARENIYTVVWGLSTVVVFWVLIKAMRTIDSWRMAKLREKERLL